MRIRKAWCSVCRSPWPHRTTQARREHLFRLHQRGIRLWGLWQVTPEEKDRLLVPMREGYRRMVLARKAAKLHLHVIRVLGRKGALAAIAGREGS